MALLIAAPKAAIYNIFARLHRVPRRLLQRPLRYQVPGQGTPPTGCPGNKSPGR